MLFRWLNDLVKCHAKDLYDFFFGIKLKALDKWGYGSCECEVQTMWDVNVMLIVLRIELKDF